MRAHFLKCVIWFPKFAKRMLRTMGRPIRIERLIQEFSHVENLVKRRKYPI
jgi:hypothetical protein